MYCLFVCGYRRRRATTLERLSVRAPCTWPVTWRCCSTPRRPSAGGTLWPCHSCSNASHLSKSKVTKHYSLSHHIIDDDDDDDDDADGTIVPDLIWQCGDVGVFLQADFYCAQCRSF